jgi:hypothetical protein
MITYDKHIPDEELAIYVAQLEDRVEELGSLLDTASGQWFRAERFSHDQIAAAWKTRVGDGDFISASKLGIERCEECFGGGIVGAPWDNEVTIKCDICNGRRWTVK